MCIYIFALAGWNVADVLWAGAHWVQMFTDQPFYGRLPQHQQPFTEQRDLLWHPAGVSVTHERQGRPVSPMAIFLHSSTDHINRICCLYCMRAIKLIFLQGENSRLATAWLNLYWYWDTTAPSVIKLHWGGQEDVLRKSVTCYLLPSPPSCRVFSFSLIAASAAVTGHIHQVTGQHYYYVLLYKWFSSFTDKSLTSNNVDPR